MKAFAMRRDSTLPLMERPFAPSCHPPGNASPRFIRCTTYTFPSEAQSAQHSHLPLGAILTPLAQQHKAEVSLEPIHAPSVALGQSGDACMLSLSLLVSLEPMHDTYIIDILLYALQSDNPIIVTKNTSEVICEASASQLSRQLENKV